MFNRILAVRTGKRFGTDFVIARYTNGELRKANIEQEQITKNFSFNPRMTAAGTFQSLTFVPGIGL